MNVNEFKNQIKKNPPLLDNRFEVLVVPPPVLQGQYNNEKNSTISYYARTLNLGGRNVITSDVRNGKVLQLPYGNQYNTATLTVMLDKNYTTKEFFDDWQDAILKKDTAILKSFYKDYTANILINHLDESGETSKTIRLVDSFPSVVGDINLASDGVNNITLISITISYRYWETL